jgi:hypothetical protein
MSRFGLVSAGFVSAILVSPVPLAYAQGQRPDPPPPQSQGVRFGDTPDKTGSGEPGWSVEVRGGAGLSFYSTSGTGQLPAPGAQVANSPFGVPGTAASSWFYGNGNAQLNAVFPRMSFFAGLPTLDPVLLSRFAGRLIGPSAGFTVARRITNRLSVELDADAKFRGMQTTTSADRAVGAESTAFTTVFKRVSPGNNAVVNASTTTSSGSGEQLVVVGTVTFHVQRRQNVDPFFIAGVGVIRDSGEGASATLIGDYSFQSPFVTDAPPIHETDNLTIRGVDRSTRPVGVFGFGVERRFSEHRGLRGTVRVSLSSNPTQTTIDANPVRALVTGRAISTSTSAGGATIVFSNLQSSFQQSTLSGPPLTGFVTFVGSGVQVEITGSVGYVFRF